jgi:ParB family chromosome partitioning protein
MADNNTFTLKSIKDINSGLFASTDPSKQKAFSVFLLPLNSLYPLKGHRFKLYTGKRFDDMVESIRENGVIIPIIVRPIDDFTYEILSGHNRVEAAKAAGQESVPAIIRENLTEDEARLIATVTNLLQRSFAEMNDSERAFALTEYYGAIKNQGRRTDIINEIENMLNASNINDSETSGTVCQKSDSRGKVGEQYDLSSRNVANYLRIEKLSDELKDRLDNGEFAFKAAVTLSYLSGEEQQIVDDILDSSHYKVEMKKAEALRTAANRQSLDHEAVEQILAGEKKPRSAKPAGFKLKPKIMSKYFTPEQKPAEIEEVIIKALDYYFANINKYGDENI